MARTMKNMFNGAKNDIFGNAAVRYAGFITALFGVMLLLLNNEQFFQSIIELVGVIMLLVGVLLCSGNLKTLFKKDKDKDKTKGATINLLIGILLIICGVLLVRFATDLNYYIYLIAGILIGVYGLLILIKFIISHRSNRFWLVMDFVIAGLLIVSGVMISLCCKFGNVKAYAMTTGIIATVTGGIGIILY